MRKISLLGLFALFLIVSLEQQASAWLNIKFGAGVNWNWQAGGNNFLWGLFRNGQPPGFGSNCDPSCSPSGFNPFNIGACYPQQQGCMMPQQYPQGPWMQQQQFMGQCPGGPPTFPSFGSGHYYPHEFQFFGSQPSTQPGYLNDTSNQTAAAYHGYNQGYQANYYSPSSSSGYYPSTSSSYYYPASASSYYYPQGAASYYYNTGYQASPYGYYYNNYNRY